MADDTLSPVGFDRRIIKTQCEPRERYALAMLRAQWGRSGFAVVRLVLLAGLDAVGWPEERRIKEYADYSVRCITTGATNEFESR